MKYKSIAEKINELKKADLELRDKLIQSEQLGKGYNEEMKKLHNNNAKKLNEIIDEIGYPSIDKVGEAANEAAWLVIQHSIGQPDFMRKCVKLLEHAVIEKKASPKNLAYLSDRIAVFEEKPQLYGTQFDWNEKGELSPNPFDDLKKVNQRRKSIGLNTLEEQTVIIRNRAKIENEKPPIDFEKRKKEMNDWKKSVGWKTEDEDLCDEKYIPLNLEDCFNTLNKILTEEEINTIKNLDSREGVIRYHHGLGSRLRSSWGLWSGSRLQKYLVEKGLVHPDSMSNTILKYYYDWLNGNNSAWQKIENT